MKRDLAKIRSSGPVGYGEALLMVVGSTLVGMMIAPRWGNSAVDLIYLPAVLAAAVLAGLGPAPLVAASGHLPFRVVGGHDEGHTAEELGGGSP